MLNLKYYANTYLSDKESEIFLKYFAKTKIKNLETFVFMLNKVEQNIAWINNEEDKNKLRIIFPRLEASLKDITPSFNKLLEFLLEKVDTVEMFTEFNWKKIIMVESAQIVGKESYLQLIMVRVAL